MFDLSQLAMYRPIFMAQLMFAEGLFTTNLSRRSHFFLRLIVSVVACILASVFFPILAYNAIFSSLMFFGMFLVTAAALIFLFDCPVKNLVFCAIAGYTVQHIFQEAYELLNVIFDFSGKLNLDFYGSSTLNKEFLMENFLSVVLFFMCYFIAFVGFCACMYLVFARAAKEYDVCELNSVTMIVIAAVIVVIDVVFSSIATFSISDDVGTTAILLLHTYNVACCVLVMILLFELPKRKQAEIELAVNRHLQEKEREQYAASKENIETLNIRCHDLKHQLRQIGTQDVIDQTYLKEIEKSVNDFDAFYKTDNEALNVILNEKNTLCRSKSIELSCILDGGSLDFIKDAHVYSLFGNLLDNAIEAVSALDKERRAIGLTIKRSHGFLLINTYNDYDGVIDFQNGVPKTTKRAEDLHGYGLKSVRNVVNIYGGQTVISAEDGVFDLSIAIPMP